MEPSTRRDAQRRLDRIGSFRAELEELEREGALTLSDRQRAALDAHFAALRHEWAVHLGIGDEDACARVSLGMRLAALLGGAAFFSAFVLFLHRVWGFLPAVTYVYVLAIPPLLLLGGAELAHRRRVHPYYVNLFVVAAGVAFVLELNALGSVLNLASSPHALGSWAGFLLLLAYAYRLRLPLYAGSLLLAFYAAALIVSATGAYWDTILERPESLLAGGVVFYALPSLVGRGRDHGFGSAYRMCGAGLLVLAVFLLSLFGEGSYLPLPPLFLETLYQLAGLALGVGLLVHGLRTRRNALVNLGAGSFLVFLYVRLHVWWWEAMPKYLFFLVLGLLAAGLLFVFRRLRGRMLGGVAP